MKKFLLAGVLLFTSLLALAEGVPATEWTQEEQAWVSEAKALYEKQGIAFSTAQAEEAVYNMRKKQKTGVPPSEWTPIEQKMVSEMRAVYQQRNLPLTEEQERLQVQKFRDQVARFSQMSGKVQALANGNPDVLATPSVPPKDEVAVSSGELTEADLATKIQDFPTLNGSVEIKGRRDGFDVNGQTILDPEGRIVSYAYDVMTGNVTYLTQSSRSYLIKFMRAGTTAQPMLIGRATNSRNGGWAVSTITGKKLSGLTLTMVPRGFLVGRDTAGFKYSPGEGIQNISIPKGYLLAPLQHGDIGTTGFVLLEKDGSSSDAKNGKALFNTIKSIGSTLGLNKKEDYALMDMSNGKLYPLNMNSDGKKVLKMSSCRKRSAFVNECKNATSFESIYEPNGNPNMGHYYWLANWFKTPSGPIAVTMENGLSDIYITDLTSGKKVVGFSRMLGIQSFTTKQYSDGHVALVASWAFKNHEIADLEEHLQVTENIPATK